MNLYICAPHSNWFLEGFKEYSIEMYLAGLSLGNISKQKKIDLMNLYLAGLSGDNLRANSENDFKQKIYVLESFYYIQDWMIPYIKNEWNFLLDSGAFTFMNDKKNNSSIDWDIYVSKYAKFITENNIEFFFELDIDSLVGIKEVERLRQKLENITQKKCIPVWHKSRGLDYWKKMCNNYYYVAIGGIVTKEIKKTEYAIFSTLLKIANEYSTKVHGLGFTSEKGIKRFKFHSVDSTSWIYGNRGGFVYKFNGKTMDKIPTPNGKRLVNKKVAIHNFKEWIKYQKYAKDNL